MNDKPQLRQYQPSNSCTNPVDGDTHITMLDIPFFHAGLTAWIMFPQLSGGGCVFPKRDLPLGHDV